MFFINTSVVVIVLVLSIIVLIGNAYGRCAGVENKE